MNNNNENQNQSGIVGDFDDFQRKYTILEFDSTATGRPMLLETYGEDLEVVRSYDNDQIWTITDAEDEQLLVPGFHLANRIAYLITEESWHDADEIYTY